MAEYIKREVIEKILFNILYEEPPYLDSDIAIKRWVKEQLVDVPSIDVSDDAISREWILKELNAESEKDYPSFRRIVEKIEDAPPVEPKRPEAIEYIQEWLKDKYALNGKDRVVLNMAIEALKSERPKGEWKSVKASIYPYGYDVECSVCGHKMGSSFGYKYCPNCGAKMKG